MKNNTETQRDDNKFLSPVYIKVWATIWIIPHAKRLHSKNQRWKKYYPSTHETRDFKTFHLRYSRVGYCPHTYLSPRPFSLFSFTCFALTGTFITPDRGTVSKYVGVDACETQPNFHITCTPTYVRKHQWGQVICLRVYANSRGGKEKNWKRILSGNNDKEEKKK